MICFEIDAFGTHLKNIDRWQYEDHLDRQKDLMSDDWKVYRISYDKVREKPRLCQQSVQHIFGKWYGASLPMLWVPFLIGDFGVLSGNSLPLSGSTPHITRA